jgi:hypothetical protein
LISSIYSITDDEDEDKDEAREKGKNCQWNLHLNLLFLTVAYFNYLHQITLDQDFHFDQIVELSIYQNKCCMSN